MKKSIYFLSSICIIAILSTIAFWLVDATVQIDDDYGILCVFLLMLDVVLAAIAYWGYKRFVL